MNIKKHLSLVAIFLFLVGCGNIDDDKNICPKKRSWRLNSISGVGGLLFANLDFDYGQYLMEFCIYPR
ncbi:MAG: hypothetical protein CR994_07950 [Maribacter sp.]|nr:MAG: hypothetical protein CR994_07950 [Maribacter sp.]